MRVVLRVAPLVLEIAFLISALALADDVKQNFSPSETTKTAKSVDSGSPVEQDDEGEAREAGQEEEKLTIPQMVKEIVEILDIYEEVLYLIPGLKRKEATSGKVEYLYTLESGQEVRLEQLTAEELGSILNKAQQHATRLHAEEIARQLDTIRRIESLQNATRRPPAQVQIPRIPPEPPRQPQIPRIPPAPPQIPRDARR